MTSAPVKDVGSLLNFVGSRVPQTGNMGAAAENFGDVMSKASGNQPELKEVNKADGGKNKEIHESKTDTSYTGKKISKAEDGVKETKTVKADEKMEEAAEKAGEKLVTEVADKLGVSEEEVISAMEQLGFGMTALLDADNLAKLVLTLSGEESSLALLTNEGLYGLVQELTQSLEGLNAELAESFGMTKEEVAKMLESINAAKEMSVAETEGLQKTEDVREQISSEKEQPAKITVTVEQATETVKMTADENGNVKQVEGVISKETAQTDEGTENNAGQKEQGQKGGLTENNPILDNLLQNKVQTVEASFEQSALHMSPETNEIMEQILDYMKIQLKPGMDQLTMQLHPESLGTLHIQITSKGGEVTAQFQVQNEAVKTAIESQIIELKESLKEQGIKVEAVEVTVESHEFESNLWQGQNRDENQTYHNSRKSPRRININDLQDGFEELAPEEEVLAAKMMEVNGNTVDYTA